MTTLLDMPWSNFCAFVKAKINHKTPNKQNARQMTISFGFFGFFWYFYFGNCVACFWMLLFRRSVGRFMHSKANGESDIVSAEAESRQFEI